MFFGWKVVITAFTLTTFAWSIGFYGPSVFLSTLHQQHGWSVSIISAAITTHYLVSSVLTAQLDHMHRRFGLLWVTRFGFTALSSGAIGWSLATQPWQLFLAATVTGTGWSATNAAAINAMVSPWFDQRRAIALSHAFNGSSVGGLVFTPLWVALIARLGFSGAASLFALVTMLVLWPLTGRYLGATPDGQPRVTAQPLRLRLLLRDRRFATLSAAFALGLFAQIGLVAHLVTRLAPVFGAASAAGGVSLATACALLGRYLLSALMGQDRRVVALGNFLMQACGSVCLALGTGVTVLLLGCVLFGLGIGNLVLLSPLIAQREFPPNDVSRIVALVTAVNLSVFSFAPAVFGWLRDVTTAYTAPFLVAAAVQLAAGVVVMLGRGAISSPARTGCAARQGQ